METPVKLKKEKRNQNGEIIENRDMGFEHTPPKSFIKFLYKDMDKTIEVLTKKTKKA